MPKPNIPTREYHPAVVHRTATPGKRRKLTVPHVQLPKDKNNVDVEFGDRPWHGWLTIAAKPIFTGKMRYFDATQERDALEWVGARSSEG